MSISFADQKVALVDKIAVLAERARTQRGVLLTEEGCKNAFVMPMLTALGYDVFNPLVVLPEFTADVGVKKGERVDYALIHNGKPEILIECKPCGSDLTREKHRSQLYRYFTCTDVQVGILTNGVEYRFYADLDKTNVMDNRPFFTFNVMAYSATDLIELEKFSRDRYDRAAILNMAKDLSYTAALRQELVKEMGAPSPDMVRMLVGRVYEGRLTQGVMNDFAPMVAAAFRDVRRDLVAQLMSALDNKPEEPAKAAEPVAVEAEDEANDDKVVTTDEELEAFHIVKSIVRQGVRAERIVMRDAQSYCAILLDNNNRKPIARLHFNGRKAKYVGFFTGKLEERVAIESVDDIYNFADRLRATIESYEPAAA